MILTIALFGALSVQAQEAGNFDDFDELYKDKAKQCAQSALVQMVIGALISQFTQVPVFDGTQGIKEVVEDCLIWALKAALIEALTGRTVNWVQTGFDGNPAFVTNVNDSLKTVADKAAGSFIGKTIPFICSPFQAEIELALTSYYRGISGIGYWPQTSCTLSESIENVEDFLDGDFSAGGWNGWFEYVGNPYNNSLGAYFETRDALSAKVGSVTGEKKTEINLGSGYLGKKTQTCYLVGPDGNPINLTLDNDQVARGGGESLTLQELIDILEEQGMSTNEAREIATYNLENGGPFCKNPDTVTPGDTVKSSLETAFGRNLDNIVSADEINEIINAAIGFITSNILSGDKGLAGYDPEDFPYTGSSTPGVDPSIDPSRPPVIIGDGSCGTGDWLFSDAETPGETLRLQKNGLVLDTGNNQHAAFQLPETEPERAYRRATMSVTVEVGDIGNGAGVGDNSQVHQIMFLQREKNPNNFKWPENNVGILNIQAERNRFIAGNNLNIQIGDCTNDTAKNNVTFEQGKRYTFTYTYDVGSQTITTNVTGPSVNFTIQDSPTADMIQSNHPRGVGQAGFFIWLGGPTGNDVNGHELPLIGWKFYDLNVTVEY